MKVQSYQVPAMRLEGSRQGIDYAENTLANLKSTTVGRNLLSEITRHSQNGREVKIFVSEHARSSTFPILTHDQMNKLNLHSDQPHEVLINAARPLALKKGRFVKGEGTRATVYWNPHENPSTTPLMHHVAQTSALTLVGSDSGRTRVVGLVEANLVHELIHAMRIVKGTYTDDTSSEGRANEERRALGVNEYANEGISENAFRREMELPLRAWFN